MNPESDALPNRDCHFNSNITFIEVIEDIAAQFCDLSEKKFRDVMHKVLAYITLLLTFPSF